jgi:nitrate reductase NapE component
MNINALMRRWLRPARKPMTLKAAVRRFALVFLALYIAGNVALLGQYGHMDWTTPPVDPCGVGRFCGIQTPVDEGGR